MVDKNKIKWNKNNCSKWKQIMSVDGQQQQQK